MMNILQFTPIKTFIQTVGKDVEKYFGNDKAAIVYLLPDGLWYAEGLSQWLKKKKKNVTLSSMEDDGQGLQEEKVKGRKVLIVNNDVISGKAYKRSTEALRTRKEELKMKDIKYATYIDRVGLADFSVWRYSPEGIWSMDEMDAIDLKIITHLSEDGRKPLAKVGKSVRLSSVAIKNRLDRLLREKILRIQGRLSVNRFYAISAQVGIEADEKTVEALIEKFEKLQDVYHLVRTASGRFNLFVGILAHNLENIETFVESEVRPVDGVRHIDVFIGELPVAPKTFPLKF